MSAKKSDDKAAVIDPYGIYGTRTAHRLHRMRRVQRFQQMFLALAIIALVGVGIYEWQVHRVPMVTAVAQWNLPFEPAAAPAWDAQTQTLFVPTASGKLIAMWPLAQQAHFEVWLDGDFPQRTSPLIVGKSVIATSADGTIYALNRQSGKVAWTHHTAGPISTRPAVLGNLLFCANDNGLLSALRLKNGKQVWQRRLSSPPGDALAAADSPAKTVIVPLAGNAVHQGGVWAFDANNGSLRWKFPTVAVNAVQMTVPVIFHERLLNANDSGALINLSIANGKHGGENGGWKKYFRYANHPQMAVLLRQTPLVEQNGSDVRLYQSGSDDVVHCLDAANGRELWRWEAPAMIAAPPRKWGNFLWIGCRGNVSYLLNPDTGKLAAKMNDGGAAFSVARGNDLWTVSQSGRVRLFRAGG